MPTKLMYFPMQGRGQSCRFALAYTGVEFEDHRVAFDEWKAIKTAGTYPEGWGMPILTTDDGKVLNQ